MRLAIEGIDSLRGRVDTIIVVPNDRLLSMDNRRMKLNEAFKVADDVLRQGVQGISDIITVPGMINVDFADVRAIMADAGAAVLGIGTANGAQRAMEAAQNAIASPLLEDSIHGATRVLVNVTSGNDLTLAEYTEAAEYIANLCDQQDANIIFGWVPDLTLKGEVRVTVLATGFEKAGRPPRVRPTHVTTPKREEPQVVQTTQAPPAPAPPPEAVLPQRMATVETPPPQPQPAPPVEMVPEEEPVRPPLQPVEPAPRQTAIDNLDVPAFLRRRNL